MMGIGESDPLEKGILRLTLPLMPMTWSKGSASVYSKPRPGVIAIVLVWSGGLGMGVSASEAGVGLPVSAWKLRILLSKNS
jgi:hypothetical protein